MERINLSLKIKAVIGWASAAAVGFIPFIVVPSLADSFTLPKVVALRFLFGLIAVLWVAGSVAKGRLVWRRTPLDIYLAALAVVILAATLFSTNRWLSIFGHYKRYEDVFSLLGYVFIYFAVVNNLEMKSSKRVISAWLAGAVLMSVYAVFQYFGYDFWRTSAAAGRSTGALGNAVFLGLYLAPALLMALARYLSEHQYKKSLLYLSITAIISAALVLTFSRGAWVGLGAGLVLLAWFSFKDSRARRRLIVGLVLVVAIFAAANLYRNPSVKRSSPVAKRLASTVNTADPTVATRLWLWRTTLILIANKPLLGYGPDTLVTVYPRTLPDGFRRLEPRSNIDKAHNDLLNTGATLGLIGLSIYLAIILLWGRLVVMRRRSIKGDTAGIIAGLASYFVASQFSFSQIETAVWFWLGLGVSVVLLREKAIDRVEIKLPDKRIIAWGAVGGAAIVWLSFFYLFAAKPAIADFHFQQGLRAESHGNMALARREMMAAVSIQGSNSMYWQRLGRRYQLDGTAGKIADQAYVRQALIAYGQAEALNPSNPTLYTSLGSLYTYLARRDKRFSRLARQAYDRSLELNRFLPETYVDRASLLAQQGQKGAAKADLRKALLLDPQNSTAKKSLKILQ